VFPRHKRYKIAVGLWRPGVSRPTPRRGMSVRFGEQDFRTPVFGSERPAQGSTNILSLYPGANLTRKFQ